MNPKSPVLGICPGGGGGGGTINKHIIAKLEFLLYLSNSDIELALEMIEIRTHFHIY